MGYRESDDSGFSRHGMGCEYDKSQSHSAPQGRHEGATRNTTADETGGSYRNDQNEWTARTDLPGQYGMVRDGGPYRGDVRGQGSFYAQGREYVGGGYGAQGRQSEQGDPSGRQDGRGFQDRWSGGDDGRSTGVHRDGENGYGFMRQGHGVQRSQTQRDPDYHQWREEQLRRLDADYDSWRKERYQKFSDEFNTWRSTRTGGSPGQHPGQSQKDGGATGGPTGSSGAAKSKNSN